MKRASLLACGVVLAVAAGDARASVGDVFGFGSRGSAMNAYAAVADDWAAQARQDLAASIIDLDGSRS